MRQDFLPDADMHAESPIKGLKFIALAMTQVSHTLSDNHQMTQLTYNEVEKHLAPFTTNSPADNEWVVQNPQKLRTALRDYMEKRHQILDVMGSKDYNAHGKKDLEANEANFFTTLNKAMVNPALTAVQRQHLRNALKEMNVTTFARGHD